MEDALVENCTNAAQEGVLASVVADVVGLASGFLIGVHSVIVWQTVTGEACLRHLSVTGEVAAWLTLNGSWIYIYVCVM